MKSVFAAAVAAAAAVLWCAPSDAKVLVPIIEGEYVSTTHVFCQPQLSINHSGGAVSTVTLGQPAPSSVTVTLEHYDPKQGIIKVSGFTDAGSNLLLNDDLAGSSGVPLAESQDATTLTFSNTVTSVTINGVAYHVVYGLRLHEVPQYFVLQTIDANGCVVQSTKVRR